jgi:quinohemoprotein ethanol dehydrogenase
MAPATHAMFDAIVLRGAYGTKGMGRFDDVLSSADAQSLHAYITDQAWQLKSPTSASAP